MKFLWPELTVAIGFLIILLLSLQKGEGKTYKGFVVGIAMAFLTLAVGIKMNTPVFDRGQMIAIGTMGGIISWDPFAKFLSVFSYVVVLLSLLLAWLSKEIDTSRISEYCALCLALALGMVFMAASTNLLMVYLALEGVSIVSYVLSGFRQGVKRSSEAALKYVIYGGVASGAMIFGMSFIYGITGSLDLIRIGSAIAATPGMGYLSLLLVAFIFIMAGFGYKVAAVPFHMWSPDVYEGSPTPFTALLSIGPKAAGFAVIIRVLYTIFGGAGAGEAFSSIPWVAIVGIISAVTMTLGNLSAIPQDNVKRMLAYSSIAHAGYMLMAVTAVSGEGVASVLLYLVIYLFMNLGAFAIVALIADREGSEDITAFVGMGTRSPFLAFCMGCFLFSLTGIPPLAGFIGKFYLFAAVLKAGGFWYEALAVIGIVNSAISLYYYARIIKAMYLTTPENESPLRLDFQQRAYLAILVIPVVILGIYWEPLLKAANASVRMFGTFF